MAGKCTEQFDWSEVHIVARFGYFDRGTGETQKKRYSAIVPMLAPNYDPAQVHLAPAEEQTPSYHETISGFTRYSNGLQNLPAAERRKIETLAHYALTSHQEGHQPVRWIQIIGHADFDTPRQPAIEKKMSLDRAARVRTALAAAIDRAAGMSSPQRPLPPYSTRFQWDWTGVGVERPIFPNPHSESERAHNRRVEVILHSLPQHEFILSDAIPVRLATPSVNTWAAQIEAAIQEFCSRIGHEEIDRHNCAAAVNRAAAILGASAPEHVSCNLAVGADFVSSKSYRAPFRTPTNPLKCCSFDAPCDREPYESGCGHCAGGTGSYLILQYGSALPGSVEKLRCVLDRGCLAVAGVLSGICDDKPDAGCARKTRQDLIWKTCPEHWLLIIGYADDPSGQGNYTFVFWDSARMSPLHICGHEFGLLYYNRAENRLSTGPTLPMMDVDKDGYHPWPYPRPSLPDYWRHYFTQKRYQVLKLGASGPYKAQTRAC